MRSNLLSLHELTNRQFQVLHAIWQHTTQIGPPGLSRVIEAAEQVGVPAGTTRNSIRRLEELGFIRQMYDAGPWVPTVNPDTGAPGELQWVDFTEPVLLEELLRLDFHSHPLMTRCEEEHDLFILPNWLESWPPRVPEGMAVYLDVIAEHAFGRLSILAYDDPGAHDPLPEVYVDMGTGDTIEPRDSARTLLSDEQGPPDWRDSNVTSGRVFIGEQFLGSVLVVAVTPWERCTHQLAGLHLSLRMVPTERRPKIQQGREDEIFSEDDIPF